MKQLEKISLAVVIGAALATAAVAQSRPQQNHNNPPAPQRQVAQRQAVQTHTVRVNNAIQRTVNFGAQNRTQTLTTHPVDTGMTNFRGNNNTGYNYGSLGTKITGSTGSIGVNRNANQGWKNTDNGNQNDSNRNEGSQGHVAQQGFGNGDLHQQVNGSHQNNGNQNRNDKNGNGNRGNQGNGRVEHSGDRDGNWRQGYEDRDDRQPSFHFSFYLSAPTEDCVPSPWYDYTAVPAYLPMSYVSITNPTYLNWDAGSLYSNGNYPLTRAAEMITSAFQTGDTVNVPQLVEGNGQVNVYNDGQYEYSLNGGEFAQMMEDNAANTQTVSFAVTSVRTDGAYATIDAAHTFTDPDGNTQTVYQEYRLENVGGNYYITDFSTSESPL